MADLTSPLTFKGDVPKRFCNGGEPFITFKLTDDKKMFDTSCSSEPPSGSSPADTSLISSEKKGGRTKSLFQVDGPGEGYKLSFAEGNGIKGMVPIVGQEKVMPELPLIDTTESNLKYF